VSGAIGSTYGTLDLLVAAGATSKQRLNTLTAQVASGHVADSYGGLGTAAQTALDLQPQIARLGTLQTNIGAATGRLDVTQTVMTQLAGIASQFYAQVNTLNGLSVSNVDSVSAAAQGALREVAGLLDTKDGTGYVFGGTDSATAPVPNPDAILSSGFNLQVGAAVAGLSANGAAATVASTLTIASSDAAGTTPFAGPPGAAPTVETGDGMHTQTGLLANKNTLARSFGTSTTGSYARDLLRSLATLGALTSSQVGAPGFTALVADTRASLSSVVDAVGAESGALGNQQAQLATVGTQLGDTATALKIQISNVQDVDLAKTLSDLSVAQTQLQASYQLIAGMKSLSLTNYI